LATPIPEDLIVRACTPFALGYLEFSTPLQHQARDARATRDSAALKPTGLRHDQHSDVTISSSPRQRRESVTAIRANERAATQDVVVTATRTGGDQLRLAQRGSLSSALAQLSLSTDSFEGTDLPVV